MRSKVLYFKSWPLLVLLSISTLFVLISTPYSGFLDDVNAMHPDPDLGCIEIQIQPVINMGPAPDKSIGPHLPRFPEPSVPVVHETKKKLLSHCVAYVQTFPSSYRSEIYLPLVKVLSFNLNGQQHICTSITTIQPRTSLFDSTIENEACPDLLLICIFY
jgi:hypothetical protein